MKKWLPALVLLWGVSAFVENVLDRNEKLSAENESLRLFNVKRAKLLDSPPADPRENSITLASHILGTPKGFIRGIWFSENGFPLTETGNKGKTDFFAKNFPLEDWTALEAARTFNRLSLEWFIETEEGRKHLPKMLKYSARIYTQMDEDSQREWVSVVRKKALEESAEMRSRIKTGKKKRVSHAKTKAR